jgi:hypothetical protein
MTDPTETSGGTFDEPCPVAGCELLTSEHTLDQARACDIAWLEGRIADMDRGYDDERAALIEGGAYVGEGELDGSDQDRLKELEFERTMELQGLRLDLEELRSAGQPAPEQEAER